MKRIAVVTDFYSIDPAYSLVGVAGNQIKMLLRAGYKPKVLVDEYLNEKEVPYPWNAVPLFKLPSIPRSNRVELPEGWQGHLGRMTEAMREGLKDIDVALSHDLIYQPAQILYNMAAREVTRERNGSLTWLHLIHSATTPALLNVTDEYLTSVKRPFPHSFIIFPNEYSRARVARNFGCSEDEVKFVPHATDFPEFMGFLEITRKLVDAKGMLDADVIIVYPARLDRGKQVEFPIRIAAQIKRLGRSVRFICCDFHSTGGDKVTYREDLKKIAQNLGLDELEVTFTSEFCPWSQEEFKWAEEIVLKQKASDVQLPDLPKAQQILNQKQPLQVRCPSEMVRDLYCLSNVFILPSRSETYSLVAQEAALCGNIVVLNFDFPPLRGVYGEDPFYFKFSSNIDAMTGFDGDTNVEYHPNVDAYCRDIAVRLLGELLTNRVVHLKTFLRKERNVDAVFRKYLEPLIYAVSEQRTLG